MPPDEAQPEFFIDRSLGKKHLATALREHHLAPRVGGAGPVATQPHELMRERFDAEALGDRRDQHHSRVTDHPLVVELDSHAIQSDQLVILHHEGDLLHGAG